MIDTVGDHTFAYSRFTQRYMIYVLVSLRLSLEIIAMHLAYSITLFFSAALMIRKFLTIFLFFSSSLINVGISYESMVSMLMWSNLWFIDTSSFEMSSIIVIWTIYVYLIIYISNPIMQKSFKSFSHWTKFYQIALLDVRSTNTS